MNQNKRYQIANVCYAIVSGNFAMFCNPKYRGDKFKWENFADMQKEHCELHVWLHIQIPKDQKIKKEIEETAANFAYEIAENLVTRAGFINKEKVNKDE
jgi:hypothetical protein